MPKQGCEIGILGLGTMGRNLVLNFADRGFSVAVYNRTAEKTREFMAREVGSRDIQPAYDLKEFAGLLRQPRALITMIAAGEPVDIVIRELLPVLAPGDLLIDGGNSHFTDTNRRSRFLGAKGILFMGLGISGGEVGARLGPSLMPGGPRDAYARVEPVFEAAAARVNGEPCVAYLGEGSAGHYVKMVHNGIEYGLMELLAESYDLMRRGLGLGPEELHDIYAAWNEEELNSFLVEITARIFLKKDRQTGKPLIDLIRDEAKQKGTGMWTSWEAMDLQVATPGIDIAVVMQDLSGYRKQRMAMAQAMAGPKPAFSGDRGRFVAKLKNGLYAGMIVVYAQGLALPQAGLPHVRLRPGTRNRGPHLARRLHHPGGPVGRYPGCLPGAGRPGQPAFRPQAGQAIFGPAMGPARDSGGRRRLGAAGPGTDDVPRLFRRLPQCPFAR